MEEPTVKGTVTSLSSMFPVEEAQKAAKRVEDALAEHQQELNLVKGFIADNTNLINLIQKLPEELHHDIMVPFGKAAFFPGRLIHTNEFLVLLGEGYYTDRTSKQTVEILKRRGKALESQLNSIKAMMQDLRAEASFFDATANESAEGLVEIREEYVEEHSSERESDSGRFLPCLTFLVFCCLGMTGNGSIKQGSSSFSEADNTNVEDEEYARIMSRLDELEQEELAAEIDNGVDEDNRGNAGISDDESNEAEQAETDFDQFPDQIGHDNSLRYSEDFRSSKPPQQTKDKNTTSKESSNNYHHQRDFSDQSCMGLTTQAVTRDNVKSSSAEKALMLPEVKDNVGAVPSSKNEVSAQTSKPGIENPKASAQTSKPGFDSHKAFTGSVVEHAPKIQTSTQEQTGTSLKPSGSQPSKPVSRFKMQRR
ncbi:hypothetical protein JRO89_XS01G0182700 [Xanthoceras sorbifolium]|uniref:RNA polymerase II subunit 5-mediating protein homolog n=1 Tax=Xanthoceras sorbifolium TaxID=99658 RepID=A0ABQ8ILB6_9ROSI|nr:hypothetical protein JRO89_XS01G0182700 [Xanthoceras sorbifolium]